MITTTIGGLPTATVYPITYNITEKLCKPFCISSSIQPVVTKSWSVASTELSGTTLFADIQCVVSVAYKPKGCSSCSLKTNTFVEHFQVSFASATADSSVSINDVNGYTEPSYQCQSNCANAYGISNIGQLTLTLS